jgi:hypothetical protein
MINNMLPPMEALRRVDAQTAPRESTFIVSGENEYGLNPAGTYNVTVGPNGVTADPIGSVPAPEGPLSPVGKLADDLRNGRITQEQYELEMQRLAPTGTSLQFTPGGGVTFSQGAGVSGVPTPPPERQANIQLFGSIQNTVGPVINEMETSFNPANLPDAAAGQLGWAGNFMRSQDAQKYAAAAAAWAEAALRLQTGAAATEPEIARIVNTYFAQPGDDPETVAWKRQLREIFTAGLVAASGGTFQQGETPVPADPQPDAIGGSEWQDMGDGIQIRRVD